VSPAPAGEPLERRAIISGIGQSEVGRRLGRSDLDLTVEAALAAIADAGITRDDIDGLATYPGMGAGTPGFGGPPSPEVQDALGLSLNWHDGGGEGPGQMRAVMAAATAAGAPCALYVREDGAAARALYERLCFRPVARRLRIDAGTGSEP